MHCIAGYICISGDLVAMYAIIRFEEAFDSKHNGSLIREFGGLAKFEADCGYEKANEAFARKGRTG
eukprot:scaffold677528_cov46-Prasinocladus_malaysianus.AAC.1